MSICSNPLIIREAAEVEDEQKHSKFAKCTFPACYHRSPRMGVAVGEGGGLLVWKLPSWIENLLVNKESKGSSENYHKVVFSREKPDISTARICYTEFLSHFPYSTCPEVSMRNFNCYNLQKIQKLVRGPLKLAPFRSIKSSGDPHSGSRTRLIA